MQYNPRLLSILHKAAVVALIVGIIDPLEGSVLIASGSTLLAFTTAATKKPDKNWYLLAWIMIIAGIVYLFYISSLGGFLGNTGRSWVWGLPILPYPAGWILTLVLLVRGMIRRKKANSQPQK